MFLALVVVLLIVIAGLLLRGPGARDRFCGDPPLLYDVPRWYPGDPRPCHAAWDPAGRCVASCAPGEPLERCAIACH